MLKEITEETVKQTLKTWWSICEAERHEQRRKVCHGCVEGSVPLISRFDTD